MSKTNKKRISRYYDNMERKRFLILLSAIPMLLQAAETVLRGKLAKSPGGEPALDVGGKLVALNGDAETQGVLKDGRLAGSDFEVVGQHSPDGRFQIEPIHKRALFTYKTGQRRMVTYWCEVCAIRTYTPGICWCCREDTELDLLEPDTVEK